MKISGILKITILSLALGAASCTNDSEQLTDSRTVPMSVQVANHIASRGLITTGTLPADDYGIGVTLVNKSDKAPYDGQTGYANNQWKTANGTTWDIVGAANPNLTGTEGVAVAYYPYSSTVTSYEAIPVESASQTDYMYSGWSNDLTNASPEATFTMQHALASVRVKLVASANYTGDKSASAVTISSDGFMATASLDASTGILSSKDGAGAEHTQENLGLTLDATGKDVDFLVIPADAPADINFIATIGGKQYAATVTPGEALAQGLIHIYTLTLSAAGMKVSTVEVTPWGVGQSKNEQLHPQKPEDYSDWLKLIYNVTDASQPVDLFFNKNKASHSFEGMTFDINDVIGMAVINNDSKVKNGIKLVDVPDYQYKFEENGEYTIFVRFSNMNCIPIGVFADCSNLKNVIIPNSMTSIGTGAFSGCSGLTEIQIPNSVSEIGEGAFARCSGLTEFIFPESLTTIEIGLLADCSGLTSIIIPNSVEKIDIGAFGNCRGLTEITIGKGVSMLRENVFYHCVNLNKIISLAVIAPYYQSDTFYNVGKNGLLIVPRGAYDSYNSTWMKTGGWHLGEYNWTLQEMQ